MSNTNCDEEQIMSTLNKTLEDIASGIPTDPWCPNMEPCDQGRQDDLDDEEVEVQAWWHQQNQDDDAIAMSCADLGELL